MPCVQVCACRIAGCPCGAQGGKEHKAKLIRQKVTTDEFEAPTERSFLLIREI